MILVCGDALIDFVPVRLPDGRDAYHPVVGGSCLNVAVAASRLGTPVGFTGGVSTDLFGQMIAGHMEASGVDIGRVTRSGLATTLAFVRYVGTSAQYVFYDDATAARLWRFDAKVVDLAGVELLHTGSTSVINRAPAAELTALIEAARGTALISIDPNCRPSLISDAADYRPRMEAMMATADILRVSLEDLEYLRPSTKPDAAAAEWLERGAALVIVTAGEQGATAYTRGARVHGAAKPVKVVDTIGAGDTFHAALLVWLREADALKRERLRVLTADDLGAALDFAATAAAITCSRPGADPPWRREMPA